MPSPLMLLSLVSSTLLGRPSGGHRPTAGLLIAVVLVALAAPATGAAASQSKVLFTDGASASAAKKKKKKQKGQRTIAKRVFVVGDSLGVGTAPYLRDALTRWKLIQTHAISRHASDGVEILRARKVTGKRYGPIVVVQLGTNDDPRQSRASGQA